MKKTVFFLLLIIFYPVLMANTTEIVNESIVSEYKSDRIYSVRLDGVNDKLSTQPMGVIRGRVGSPPDLNDRFFLSGDGTIHLKNAKSGRSAVIRYRLSDGSYPERARQQINRVFDVPEGSSEGMSLRLISLLDHIEDRYRQPIEIVSGYRSPEYNEGLRQKGRLAAKASLHMEGMAADIRMRKMLSVEVFGTLKDWHCCGVGYYHSNSLHIDTGPDRYWDETSSKVNTDISSHNKLVLLRTDQDVYLPGEKITFRLARLTDYPVGVDTRAFLVDENGKHMSSMVLEGADSFCYKIEKPEQRIFSMTLPPDFHPAEKVQVELHFCHKPFPEMPGSLKSNTIKIFKTQ